MPGKAGAFLENLYGALDKGEEGDIVSRSIVCCRNGNPVAMPPPPQPTPIKAKPVSAQEQAKKAADPYKAGGERARALHAPEKGLETRNSCFIPAFKLELGRGVTPGIPSLVQSSR